MLQELRYYWLPLMLFVGTLLIGALLLLLVVLMPFLVEYLPKLALFAEDATVRRTSIAGAVGLIVTAFVFFRPKGSILAPKNTPSGDATGES